MNAHTWRWILALLLAGAGPLSRSPQLAAADPVDVQLDRAAPPSGVRLDVQPDTVWISWATGRADEPTARLVLTRRPDHPALIRSLAIRTADGRWQTVASELEPVWFLTVGTRRVPPGKPSWQKWFVFFDNPARRPHETFTVQARLDRIAIRWDHPGVVIDCGSLSAGPFRGRRRLIIYPGCDLLHCVAALSTERDRLAIVYDAGVLDRAGGAWQTYGWIDTEDRFRAAELDRFQRAAPLRVRYRTVAATAAGGSLACFAPPHQFQFPRDWTDNLGFVWAGPHYRGSSAPAGIGIRQPKTGGGAWVPWFNAPPNREHRLSFFICWTSGTAEEAIRFVRRYTNDDRFVALPGYRTFTSHYHMAVAVTAMQRAAEGKRPLDPPEFVRVFKRMGVEMVHLAEFHGDGHQKDPGPLRLKELSWMFRECRRLSDETFLLIPGEEVNTFLGLPPRPGRHPGHWMSLFPRPVYWIMHRGEDQPFVTTDARYGKVYRVGSTADMMRLLEREHGLVWTAHPRIKASSWTPDVFRDQPWFLADYWLGAAWKAMPGDLSEDRLGIRALDLLDDMANWGVRKYVLGEVDVFKIDHTHELYSHMNINYVKLAELPRFDQGWQPVLTALRSGRFFVSTGEVLIPMFTVAGRESGQTVRGVNDGPVTVRFRVRWTFPLKSVWLVSGDGKQVRRRRIDALPAGAFGEREFELTVDLSGQRWVRLEAWDVAVNGAFTQPVWLEP